MVKSLYPDESYVIMGAWFQVYKDKGNYSGSRVPGSGFNDMKFQLLQEN